MGHHALGSPFVPQVRAGGGESVSDTAKVNNFLRGPRHNPLAVLEVDNLAKRYGDVLALEDLTVRVEGGKCLVLLGRNGAGKTTALRCMAGVLLPSAGTVRVDGINAADDPAAVRALVGLMPEVPGLYERMSARAYLDHFIGIYGLEPLLRRRRIDELLENFELTDAGDRWLG